MADEIYDVVDKKANKIGTATWTQCHVKGLLHQCAHGLVFSDEQKTRVLVQKRSKNAVQGAGLYEASVAGHILSDETPDEAIIRELQEELFGGLSLPGGIKIKRLLSFFNNDLPNNHEIAYLFEIILDGESFTNRESEEKPQWVEWETLLRRISFSPKKYAKFFRSDIKEYLKSTSGNKN